jgi:ferric-dicitrate binding protein FerR (iron transport regulator)
MQNIDDLDPNDRELAESLKQLSPVATTIDPLAAAFAAGARRARRQTRLWQSATALAVALCGLSWINAAHHPTPGLRQPAAIVEQNPQPPDLPLPDQNVMVLQNAVLAHGLAGLPPAEHTAVKVLRVNDLL